MTKLVLIRFKLQAVRADKNTIENQEKPSKLPLVISFSLAGSLAACYFLIPSFQAGLKEAFRVLTSDDEQRIEVWVEQFGLLGPIVLIAVMVVQMFLFVVPNVLLMIIAIISYGPVWGSVLALVGVFTSSTVGYLIGRRLGPVTVNKLIHARTRLRLQQFIEDYGMMAIAITRLSSLSNDSLSIVAGLLKMSYHKYILATLSGITPLIVLLALYGRSGRIERALIWIAAISMVLLVLYIIIDRRRKKKRRKALDAPSLSADPHLRT